MFAVLLVIHWKESNLHGQYSATLKPFITQSEI